MKRLFRNSKASVIDPLPPPSTPPPAPGSGSSTPRQLNQSMSSITLNGNSNSNGGGQDQPQHEHNRWGFGLGHGHRQNEVTPFPSDVGRDVPPPPPEKGRKGKERGSAAPPSMLEIQQMQERDEKRRQQPPSQQHRPPPPTQQHAPSPDRWSLTSPPAQPPSTGFDPPFDPNSKPLPIPNPSYNGAVSHTSTSPSSAGTQIPLYLPPGARPPSPSLRRPSYTSAPRHSQSSVSSSAAPYGTSVEGEHIGRERGYSVASAAGSARSDHESGPVYTNTNGNSLPPHSYSLSPQSNAKLPRPPSNLQSSRSPLANPYPTSDNNGSTVPAPHPYNSIPPTISPAEQLPNPLNQADGMAPASLNLHNLPARPGDGELSRENGKDKEKKRFWGMGWGDKKGKGRDKDRERDGGEYLSRPSVDESRRSVDGWKENDFPSQSTSAHGHEHEEPTPRGRLLGLDFGGGKRDGGVQQVSDVTSAIRKSSFVMTSPRDIACMLKGSISCTRHALRDLRSFSREYI